MDMEPKPQCGMLLCGVDLPVRLYICVWWWTERVSANIRGRHG